MSMKICSLIPSGTEIAFALGLGDRVIAVTEYCNYPPEAQTRRIVSRGIIDIFRLSAREVDEKVQELAKTGKPAYEFDTEWLVEAKPDLVLTQDMCRSCDLEAGDVFRAIVDFDPKPQVLILSPRRLADIFTNIGRLAQANGVSGRAEQLIEELQSRIDRIRFLVSKASSKPRVLFLEWLQPPSPAGDWIPEQIELAGGKNLLGQTGEAPARMSWEAVFESDPDVIVVGPCSHDISRSLREMVEVARFPGWWNLRAVRAGNVYILASEFYDRPGPRVIDGIELLAQLLHPDLVTDDIAAGRVVKLEPIHGGPPEPQNIARVFRPYTATHQFPGKEVFS